MTNKKQGNILSSDSEARVYAYHKMVENIELAFAQYLISFKRTLNSKVA